MLCVYVCVHACMQNCMGVNVHESPVSHFPQSAPSSDKLFDVRAGEILNTDHLDLNIFWWPV